MSEPHYGYYTGPDIETIYQKSDDFTNHGQCSRCGNCCPHHLPLLSSEVERIQAYIKDHNIEPVHHGTPGEPNVDLMCPFYNHKGIIGNCSIYDIRPIICRVYQCNLSQDEINQRMTDEEQKQQINWLEMKSHHETEMWQTFYPDKYTPKDGDIVIINQIHMIEHLKHQNDVYMVTNQKHKKHGITEVFLRNPATKEHLWFDIKGLTVIQEV